jgi:IS30 family transposase
MKAGHDQTQIAKLLDRHKSTISRELSRNRQLKSGGGAADLFYHHLTREGAAGLSYTDLPEEISKLIFFLKSLIIYEKYLK